MADLGEQQASALRRLRPLYLAAGLQNFVLWYAIEKPFLEQIGLSSGEMVVLAALLNVVIVSCNVPLGVLADRWSRKGVLMVAGVCLTVASTIGAMSDSFVAYALAMLVFGFFMAAHSGGFDSVVYDTVLEENGDDGGYNRLYGRVKVIEGVTLASSSLLGGLTAAVFEPRLAYALSVPCGIASIVALAAFREPQLHRAPKDTDTPIRLVAALRLVLGDPSARWVAMSLIGVSVGIAFMSYLDQLWLLALSLPLAMYGPVNAVLLACYSFGGHAAGRKERSARDDLRVGILGLLAAGGLLVENIAVVIVSQCVFLGCLTLLLVSHGRRLHAVTASTARTSVSSAVSTVGTLVFVPLSLVFGWIADDEGVFVAAWMVVGVAGFVVAASWFVDRCGQTAEGGIS